MRDLKTAAAENIVFPGGDTVSLQEAEERVRREAQALRDPREKGSIPRSEARLAVLRREAEEASGRSRELLRLAFVSRFAGEKAEKDKATLAVYQKALDDYEMLGIRRRRESLCRLEEEYRDILSAGRTLIGENTRKGFFPDTAFLARLKEAASLRAERAKKAAEAEETLRRLEHDKAVFRIDDTETVRCRREKRRQEKRRNFYVILAAVCCALMILFSAFAAWRLVKGERSEGILLAAGGVLALLGMIGGFVFSSVCTARLREIDALTARREASEKARLDTAAETLEGAKAAFGEADARFRELAALWELDADDPDGAVAETEGILTEEARLSAEAEELRFRYINRKAEHEEKSLHEPADDGRQILLPAGFDYRDALKKAGLLRAMIRGCKEKKRKADERLVVLSAEMPCPAACAEAINLAEEEKREAEFRLDVCLLADAALRRAGAFCEKNPSVGNG